MGQYQDIRLLSKVERIGTELGRGAYGVVVEMKLSDGTRVAGKKIHDVLFYKSDFMKSRFEEECLM